MLLIASVVIGAILGRLSKKSVNINIRSLYIVIIGILVGILGNVLSYIGIDILIYSQMISTIFIVVFMLRNYKELFVVMVGVGHSLNAIVMIANGGKMPIKAFSGMENIVIYNRHFIIYSDVNLHWLADIIKPPYPLDVGNNMVSIGDIILFIGLGILSYKVFNIKLKNNIDSY